MHCAKPIVSRDDEGFASLFIGGPALWPSSFNCFNGTGTSIQGYRQIPFLGTLCAIASSSFLGNWIVSVVQIILVRDSKWQRILLLYGIAANHALSWFAAVKILTQKLPI